MKSLLIIFLIIAFNASGQNTNSSKQSRVDVHGNSNIIKVIQGNNVTVYNLSNEKETSLFFQYLKTIPSINTEIEKVLNNQKQTLSIVKKIQEEGVLNTAKFITEIEKYIRETDSLRAEIAKLKIETNNTDFAKVLDDAGKKLDSYDNDQYQQVLENYKTEAKKKLVKQQKEIANASYLQTINNYNNYYYEKALEQIDEALMYDDKNAEYLILKGVILLQQFKLSESIRVFIQVQAITGEKRLLSASYNNIGEAYRRKGNYDSALNYYNLSLTAMDTLTESNLSHAYNNIALVYSFIGHYQKALQYYNQAIKAFGNSGSKDSSILFISYGNMSFPYREESLYDSAFIVCNLSLNWTLKNEGILSVNAAVSYNHLGGIYRKLQDTGNALKCYRNALIILKKLGIYIHTEVANSYDGIGLIYNESKTGDSALFYFSKALEITKKIEVGDNAYTADIYTSFALYHEKHGIRDSALKYYDLALEIRKKILGAQSLVTAHSYEEIALFYDDNNFDSAFKYLVLSLNIERNYLGEKTVSIADSYGILGKIFFSKLEYDSSLKYYYKSLNISEQLEPYNITLISKNYDNIGYVYENMNKYDSAIFYYRKNIDLRSFDTGQSYLRSRYLSCYNITFIFNKEKLYDSSIRYLKKALDIGNNINGEIGPGALLLIANIGTLYVLTGQDEEGLNYLKAISASHYVDAVFLDICARQMMKLNNDIQFINVYTYCLELLDTDSTSEQKKNTLRINIYRDIATAYCNNDDKSKAAVWFEKAIQLALGISSTQELIDEIKEQYNGCRYK